MHSLVFPLLPLAVHAVHNLFGFGGCLKAIRYAVLGLAYLRQHVFLLSGGIVLIFFGSLFHEAM